MHSFIDELFTFFFIYFFLGMTFVDVLAAGSMGHIIAVGMLLGFNNMAQ